MTIKTSPYQPRYASFNKLSGSTVTEWKFTSDPYTKSFYQRKGIAYEASFKANGTL